MYDPVVLVSPVGAGKVAEWLQDAGFYIGERFGETFQDDDTYVDRDFADYSELLLDTQELTPAQWRRGFEETVIGRRSTLVPWSWNDPRNCQILNAITEYFPKALYISIRDKDSTQEDVRARQKLIDDGLPKDIWRLDFDSKNVESEHPTTKAAILEAVDVARKRGHGRRPRIYINVPNLNWVHYSVAAALLRYRLDNRVDVNVELSTHRPYVQNLNRGVKNFMESDYDFWLNMDADNAPKRNPFDLAFLDRDVIGLAVPIWKDRLDEKKKLVRGHCFLSGMKRVTKTGYAPHQVYDQGIQEVDAVGSGCMMVARRVFEGMNAPFMRKFNKEGLVTLGCDYYFSQKAKRNGWRIWCHFDYICRHFKELELESAVFSCYRSFVLDREEADAVGSQEVELVDETADGEDQMALRAQAQGKPV